MKILSYIGLVALLGTGAYAVWTHVRVPKTERAAASILEATSTPEIPVPEPTAQIFSDTLEPAWQNSSWNAIVSTSRSSSYLGSSASLSVAFQKDWSGLYLRSSGYTPKESSLSFAINAGTPENEDLYISLYGIGGKSLGAVPLLKYIPKFHMEKDKWYRVVIPLSTLHASGKEITGFVVESAHTARVYFDDIRFVTEKPTPLAFLTPANALLPTLPKSTTPIPDATTTAPSVGFNYENPFNQSMTPVPTLTLPVVIKAQPEEKASKEAEPAPKPLPSTAQNIYLDSLLSGWTLADSSNVNLRFKPAYHGDYAMHLGLLGSWNEITFIHPNGVDASGYDGLWLAIKGDQGGEDVQLILYSQDGAKLGSARIEDFVEGLSISSKEYRQAYIPFRTIKLKKGIIGKIVLTSEKQAGFSIDDFQFSGEPSSLPAGGYTITAGPVFDSGFQNGWYVETWKASQNVTESPVMIESRIEEPGGGLYFKNNVGVQTHTFHRVKFQIKGPALSGPKISFALYDPAGKLLGSAYLNDYFQSNDFTAFQTLSLPLVYLGAEDSLVGSIVFSSGSTTETFDIANLRFEF